MISYFFKTLPIKQWKYLSNLVLFIPTGFFEMLSNGFRFFSVLFRTVRVLTWFLKT